MATPTLVLDKVNGAELIRTRQGAQYIRMGHVENIDLAGSPDPDALVKVLPLLPPFGASLGPQSPGLKLSRIRVRPELAKFGRANVELLYDTDLNLTPTAYLLRDRTFLRQKTTLFIPGTRYPILIGFEHETGESSDLDLDPEPLFFQTDVSCRAIQLTMLQYGRPAAGTQNFMNYANNAPWPTGDAVFPVFNIAVGPGTPPDTTNVASATALPIGYWKLGSYSTEYNRQTNMTLVESEAITQVIEDWSEVGMLRNEKTGKYPFASIATGTRLSILNTMLIRSYAYGPIYPLAGEKHRGIARWGNSPLCDFSSLFGFGWLLALLALSLVFLSSSYA